MSEQEILRVEIERSRAGRSGRWRCPGELRERIAAHIRERRGAGAALKLIAGDLGLSESSVLRWSSPHRPGKASKGLLLEVEVGTVSQQRAPGLAVVTPRGYRFEGLSEGLALRLLRKL